MKTAKITTMMMLAVAITTRADTLVWTNQATGTRDFGSNLFWGTAFTVPGVNDTAVITNNNAGPTAGAQTITNGAASTTIGSLLMSNSAASTRGFTLQLSNQIFMVNNTMTLGANGTLQIGVNGTGIATAIVNNVAMSSSGGTITFGHVAIGNADTLIITGSFVNTSANVIKSSGGDWNLIYSNNSQFVNAGTINPVMTTANGNGNIIVGSPGQFTNTLLNTGLILLQKTTGNNSATNTIVGGLVNQGSIVISNSNGTGLDGRVFFNVIAPGRAVTNDSTGVWTFFSNDSTGSGTGIRNSAVLISNADFVNRGILNSDYRISNVTGGLKTNTFALSAGQVFSNAPGGQVIVSATSDPTRTTFLIQADRVINAGTNAVFAGQLSLRNSAGTAAVPLENSGLLRVDGTFVAATVTNSGQIQGTGTISANVFNVSGGTFAPGNSIGTNNVIGNVSFGSNATFAVELSLVDGTSDLLKITGGLTLDTNSILNITGGATGNVYTALTFNASSLVGTFGTVTPGYTVGYDNAGGLITLQVIPEPSTLMLVGAGLALAGVAMRQRRRS